MFNHGIRMLALFAVAAGVSLAGAGGASAVGSGTFTRITDPSGTTTFSFDGTHPGNNHITVSGDTSSDVTGVDIDCIWMGTYQRTVVTLASSVPVTSQAFSTVVTFPHLLFNCRLRAIPSGVDPATDYLGSYAGPVLYMTGAVYDTAGSTVYGYTVVGEQGDGAAVAQDAAQCGPENSLTIEPPGMELLGTGSDTCAFSLPSGNVTTAGPTASAIKVDGHNAYLPFSVHSFLNVSLGLGLPQPALSTALTRSGNGDVTVTEAAPLRRCSHDDTYPPTSTSCPSLGDTGVRFTRTLNLIRGDHQIRVRDAFISSDGHPHTVALQYEELLGSPPTGATGYTFPGRGSIFHQVGLNQVVTGLGTKAGTMFARSDLYSVEGDPAADTLGLTWSRAPQRVLFSGSTENSFALPYALEVPANGTVRLGFAYSRRVETRDASTLAIIARNEMVLAPTISSPSNRADVRGHRTTVRGSVAVGANGLPTKVIVNGHAAHLTRLSATKEAYAVSFSESFGRHTIVVTAEDVVGNTRSASIIVRNVAS